MADSDLPPGFQLDPEPTAPGPENVSGLPPGFVLDEDRFGDAAGMAKAAAAGLARGASLGTSDIAAQEAGIATKEELSGWRKYNPITSFATEALGSVLPIAATEGAAAPLALGKIGTSAMVGGVLGAGNIVSDSALGEPNLTAQKILADIGGGIVGGAAFGALEKGLAAVPALWRAAPRSAGGEGAEAAINAATAPTEGAVPKPNTAATSLSELKQQLSEISARPNEENTFELSQAPMAREAAERINSDPEMRVPIGQDQLDSLTSEDARKSHLTDLAIPGENGEALRNRNVVQKKDLSHIIDSAIEDIAPGYEPTADAQEAGGRAASYLTETLEPARKTLGSSLGALKGTDLDGVDHLPGVVDYLTKAIPGVADMFDTTGEELASKPWSSKMGLSERGYTNIRRALEDIQEENPSVEQLFNIRKNLDNGVNLLERGGAGGEMTSAKAAMMSYIQDAIHSINPEAGVRDAFAAYAKNEENIKFIEKTVGAQIGDDWRSSAANRPESGILNKIFRDTETVRRLQEILPADKFNQITADYMAIQKNAATREGILSSAKFSNKLNGEGSKYALKAALDPDVYQKLKDATALLRIFPDSMPANPSQTVPTLLRALAKGGLNPLAQLEGLGSYAKEKFKEAVRAEEINAKMAGISEQNLRLKSLQNMAQRTTDAIAAAAKSVWTQRAAKGATILGGEKMSDSVYENNINTLRNISSNPSFMAQRLSEITENLSHSAPNIAQGVQNTIVRGVNFLTSKIPPAKSPMIMADEYEPSAAEKAKFARYYHAISSPISAVSHAQRGDLSPETMEAIQAVHPHLLDEMRKQIMSEFKPEAAKSLSFSQKAALSRFLGIPLNDNMTPQAAANNQIVFASPSQSTKSAVKPTRATLGGMKKLNSSNRSKTKTQEDNLE